MFGLFFRRKVLPQGNNWKSMAIAPRDGTTIELCCTYGVAPWYGIYAWKSERNFPDGTEWKGMEPTWVCVTEQSKSVSDEAYLYWRPYNQTGDYVDPTNGAQNTSEYWRKACGI
jgi:hypothetical protein